MTVTGLKFKSLLQMKYNAGKAPTLQAAFSCVSQQDVAKMADKAASQFQPRGQGNDANPFAGFQREADPLMSEATCWLCKATCCAWQCLQSSAQVNSCSLLA